MHRFAVTRVMMFLAACFIVNADELAAQPPAPLLVVVAEPSVGDWVKRIGGNHVRVELLLPGNPPAPPKTYGECDKRARRLLAFRLLVVRAIPSCPNESFWRDRLKAANPDGKVHRMSVLRRSKPNDPAQQIHRANEVHKALVSILPAQRATLDENLKSELRRLHSLRLRPPQFVSRQ